MPALVTARHWALLLAAGGCCTTLARTGAWGEHRYETRGYILTGVETRHYQALDLEYQ